ncbi:MAG: hypothetical protein LBB22_03885 [Treponema sp.]|jgi:hypothetical protein|nr:hypothetical protein [Treponema sp.]
MTISKNIVLLKIGIAVSFFALLAFAVFSQTIFPVYPSLINYKAAARSGYAVLTGILPAPSPYTAFAGVGAAVLFAFVMQATMFYFFEKTQSVEIRFLGIFLFSFTFEILRIALPLKTVLQFSSYIPVIAARFIAFGRFYGLFSLFSAGLYASGLKMQREENFIFPMFIIAVLFAIRIPLDTFNYDTSLYPVVGISYIFKITETAIVLLSVFCFISGAYTRGNREYYFIAIGILAAAIGRSLLFSADTWFTLIPAFAILVFGAWFTGKQFRRMYLWA